MTNPTEEDWIKLPKEVADAVRGWCLQNGFDGDGRVSYVYAGCALVAITSLLDYQQSKLEEVEEQKEAAYRSREGWRRCALDAEARVRELESQIEAAKVDGFKWVDVKQEMPPKDEVVITYCGGYQLNLWDGVRWDDDTCCKPELWMALPTVADLKRGEE